MNIRTIGKNLGVRHNVSFRVIDEITGEVISTHIGHNSATNSLLTGIGHYLKGDGVLDQGWHMLSHYVPKYISLGTMGLLNQDEDSIGLPAGIGVINYEGRVYGQISDDNLAALGLYVDESVLYKYPNKTLSYVEPGDFISTEHATALRYIDYLTQSPGFGADGYSSTLNNNRIYLGLGPAFADRADVQHTGVVPNLLRGDIDGDGNVTTADLKLLVDYLSGKVVLTDRQLQAANVTYKSKTDSVVDMEDVQAFIDFFDDVLDNSRNLTQEEINACAESLFGTYTWDNKYAPTINCELISDTFPRCPIGYRDIIPELEAEFPKTIDVVFSAMISTGALAQFREPGRDYIFITEAGLWSEQKYTENGDNGLLAGYRIAPPNKANWDMAAAKNRTRLQEEILKVGKNQVVQVIWKIQLGSIDQFEGIESLYPSTESIRWIEHGSLLCNIKSAKLGAGWSDESHALDLAVTYDSSPGTKIDLIYSKYDADIVYELDDAYDVTAIQLQLGHTDSDVRDLGNVTFYVSKDGNSYEYVRSYTNAQIPAAGSLLNIDTDEIEYKDIRFIKVVFNNSTVAPIAEIKISALDSTEIPEGTTSLKWNVF